MTWRKADTELLNARDELGKLAAADKGTYDNVLAAHRHYEEEKMRRVEVELAKKAATFEAEQALRRTFSSIFKRRQPSIDVKAFDVTIRADAGSEVDVRVHVGTGSMALLVDTTIRTSDQVALLARKCASAFMAFVQTD